MHCACPALEESYRSLHHHLNTKTCPFPQATASSPRFDSSSKSWPLAMFLLASPSRWGRKPRLQPRSCLPQHGKSSLGWLICGGPSHHDRFFQPGTSVSASVRPHPKKMRITSQWALSLWPELWLSLHRVHSRAAFKKSCSCGFPPGIVPQLPSMGALCVRSSRHSITLVQVMPSDSQRLKVSGSTAEAPEPPPSQPRKWCVWEVTATATGWEAGTMAYFSMALTSPCPLTSLKVHHLPKKRCSRHNMASQPNPTPIIQL